MMRKSEAFIQGAVIENDPIPVKLLGGNDQLLFVQSAILEDGEEAFYCFWLDLNGENFYQRIGKKVFDAFLTLRTDEDGDE